MRPWLLLLVGLSSFFALSTSVNRAKNSGSDFDLESRASTTNVHSILSKRKLRAFGGDTNTLKDSGKARREEKVWKLFCSVFLQLDDKKKCMFETNQVSSHQPEPRPALSFMPGPKPAHSLVPESKPVRSLMTGNAPVRSIATELKLVLPRITETVKNPSKSQVVMLWLHKVADFSKSEHGVNTMAYRTLYEWLSPSFSDAKLAKFFVGLREDEALRETAEKMLAYMLIKSTSTEAVGRAWLKSGEHPSRLFESMNFKEADFKDTVFLGWLKYAS
uniref:Secreted RxLR effector protein 144 n=1 Tax=Plasmopara viticola TaxID=143451 RepID=RL144_PLAVT|nr:RecName: Full=Secreted RxLR effector protein 144; Flags: Precursor [Plasmopara viticola]